MKERGIILFIFAILLSVNLVAAASVNSEIQKITHYAEEYETGNINYVQLLVYISSAREGLNEVLGATQKNIGGVVKQDKLKEVLGEPNEETKWVWVEGEEHDAKLDYYVPIWKKIIFDGGEIQIRMEAFPSIFKKEKFYDEFEEELPEEGSIIYRLHFDIEFKKPEEQLDIQGKINEIAGLAEIFNTESSQSNAESLAKESVNAERIFENYFRQGGGKCEDLMKSIFGSENQRETQQILLNEITFLSGDNFEAIIRLEMCDECEWNWINLDLWIEGRGPGFKPPKDAEDERESKERFKGMDESGFKTETAEILDETKRLLEQGDFSQALAYKNRLWMLNEAWNEKANDVWEEIEKIFPKEQSEEIEDPYYWIKQDQIQRQKVNQLRKQNYENRKQFYLDLFSGFEKREYYFSQTEFEKRLIEEFKERGEEICNNNQDDNDNEAVDCDDAQCGGKICGRGTQTLERGNETKEIEVDFYCISGTCRAKEEINETQGPVCGNHICEQGEKTCSSSVVDCNEDNSECFSTADCGYIYCPGDCIECPKHDAIECSGRVEFGGEDETGCPLPPICIEETEYCNKDEDCTQPKCGVVGCVRTEPEDEIGACQMITLTKCGKGECEDGEKQIKECDNREMLVVKVCMDGVWKETGKECEGVEEKNCNEYCMDYMSTIMPECPGDLEISGTYPDCECDWVCKEIVGNECMIKSDCGGENDVCSNGECVEIPQVIQVEPTPEHPISPPQEPEPGSEEPIDGEELEVEENVVEETPEPEPEEPETAPVTGGVIFNFFQGLLERLRITGFAVEDGGDDGGEGGDESVPEPKPEEPAPDEPGPDEPEPGPGPEPDNDCADKWKACGDPCPPCDYDEGPEDDGGGWEDGKEGGDSGDWERRNEEERKMHEEENKERCEKECRRPCVEKCIREKCGEAMDCNIDKESKECEGDCQPEENCIKKCMSGEEDWWKEFEEEHKEEKGVFQAGGGCRTQQGRTEGFIWFGGWGDPFEQIQPLKHKYYSGGEADWCKHDIENLVKQRQEFEKGFNQEFAQWFFEKYLPNSAEDWEQAQSGIFELYWKSVDNQMQLAHRMQCLEKNNINDVMTVNLIEIEYETEYGRLEYWEEIKEVSMPELDRKVTLISPYMKIWIFPSEEFIKYEMKKSMEDHEFSGPPEEKMERKNQGGLTEEQKEDVRDDETAMRRIREVSERYGGTLNLVIQFKDYETNEIVFNLYAQINEQKIMEVEPMLPSEVPEKDSTVEMDFALLYQMIYTMEKDMAGTHIESPPWDRKLKPIQKLKEIGNGIKMWNRMRVLKNSAKITPEKDEKTIEKMAEWIMETVMRGGGPEGPRKEMEGGEGDKGEEKDIWEDKEVLTGEVFREF